VGDRDSCLAAFQGATSVTYAWQANGKAISGATSHTYKIPDSLLGKTLTCSVTATNSAGSVSGTSSGAKVTRDRDRDRRPGRDISTAALWSLAAPAVPLLW
jgi:hypothetical protein